MSAMHDPHPHSGVQDDTTDLGPPIHYPDDDPDTDRSGRLRPTTLVRRVHGTTILGCYAVTLASAAWLLVLAVLHMQALIMILNVGVLAWLLPDVPRLYRWLRGLPNTGQALPASWQAQLVVTLITALNLFLLVYAHA